jgi:hypothetical protein
VRYGKWECGVVQIYPGQAYDHDLASSAIAFLQTRDPALFPFTSRFDEARMKAFVRDLREGLSDLTDSGSARKTSAAGFMMRDRRLRETIADWASADGDWPVGSDPSNPNSGLGTAGPL